jgi:hypothetical protein
MVHDDRIDRFQVDLIGKIAHELVRIGFPYRVDQDRLLFLYEV